MKMAPTTKSKILEISIALFAQNGFAETSIRDIAKEADIKSSSIYYYFESKDDILYEILDMSRQFFISLKNWDEFKENLNARSTPVTAKEIISFLFYRFDESEAVIGVNMLKIIFMEASRDETVGDFFANEYLVNVYNNVVEVVEYLNNNNYARIKNVRMICSALFSLALSFINLSFFNINQLDPQEAHSNMFDLMEHVLNLEMNK